MKPLTVRELIAALQALPPEQQDFEVHCFAEAGCVTTPVGPPVRVNVADRTITLDGE